MEGVLSGFKFFKWKAAKHRVLFAFFLFCFSFSFVIWSARYAVSCLVLFMFRVVRYSLSLGRDMERNQSQNQRMWEEQDDNSGKGEKWKTRAKCWMVKWMRMVVNMPYMKTGMQHYILLWNYHGYHAYFLTVFIIFTQFYILFSNIYIWVCVCLCFHLGNLQQFYSINAQPSPPPTELIYASKVQRDREIITWNFQHLVPHLSDLSRNKWKPNHHATLSLGLAIAFWFQ